MDWLLGLAWLLAVFFGSWIPKDAESWIERGRDYAAKGNDDRAIEAFNKAVRLDPKNAAGYEARDDTSLRKGEFERAVADYNEALQLLPKGAEPSERARILSQRGVAYCFAEDYDRALADQDEVIRLDRKSAVNYFDRAATYLNRKDYPRALADYTQAIRLEPAFVFAYTSRASVYEKLQDYQRAVADLREAVHCDPQDIFDTHLELAWLLATCPDAEIRDGRDAVKYARKACAAQRGEDSLCIAVLAAAYAETGNFKNAVKWQRKAVELAENSYRERMRQVLKLYDHGERYREK